MPERPISLALPATCPHCGAAGQVHLQQTIRGERVRLEWRCQGCQHEWLVRHKDEAPGTP
jgi:transposase-like protein